MTMEKMSEDPVENGAVCDDDIMKADSDDEETSAEPLMYSDRMNLSRASNMSLKQQARQLVINVREYFRRERDNSGPLLSYERILERTSAALKLKPAVIVRLTRNGQNTVAGRPDVNMRLHPLRIDAIKNFVEMYYRTDPNASITKAYEKLVRSGLFSGSHTTLRRMLQNEGFDFIRGKRRCESFTKVKHEFIFEEYMKDEDEPKSKEAKMNEEDATKLEPLDSLQCEKEDLEFFRSVLPSVAKLSDCDKLTFRMAVMSKVQNLLYQPSPPVPPK